MIFNTLYLYSQLLPKYSETQNSYNFKFNLAGTKKSDVNVSIENNYLQIKVKDKLYFKEDLTPIDYSVDNVKANYMDGILEVTLQKTNPGKNVSITIE